MREGGQEIKVYHIRRKLTPARGNQWYRDKSDRGNGTYCGAPETDKDLGHRDKPLMRDGRWDYNGETWLMCTECERLRAESKR